MRMVVRMLIAALSLFAMSATSENFGKVRLPGEATIKHEGDYVVYDLTFASNCYAEEQDSIAEVSNNVSTLASWLDNKTLNFSNGTIEYWADLISTTRDSNPYITDYYRSESEDRIANPCYQKYSTTQSVSIRVSRAGDAQWVSRAMVQDFYDALYQYLWPLNRSATSESGPWASAKITHVHKGVYDETLKQMKEQAYASATHVAQARFLAVLGKSYGGQWFFYSADFSNERSYSKSHRELDSAILPPSAAAPPLPPAFVVPPAVINLEPLEYSIDGVFEFWFTRDFNNAAL